MDDWRPIADEPTSAAPFGVMFYYEGLYGELGNVAPGRNECYALGFWDGAQWIHAGTGHEVFEFEDWPGPYPTHWTPLPEPPMTAPVHQHRE